MQAVLNAGEKLNTLVDFPLFGLDLGHHLASLGGDLDLETEDALYDLYAVSNHYGTMRGGHYTAYIRLEATGQWVSCDDTRCVEVEAEEVVTTAAYVLFYKKRHVTVGDSDQFQDCEESGVDSTENGGDLDLDLDLETEESGVDSTENDGILADEAVVHVSQLEDVMSTLDVDGNAMYEMD